MQPAIRVLPQAGMLCLLLAACGGGSSSSTTSLAPPPLTPTNLTATGHDGYNVLQWNAAPGATAYNLYWSSQSGVNKTNGNKINHRESTLNHGALTNGQTYYYVIAAENSGGESAVSNEVSATPVTGSGANDPLFTYQWHLNNGNASQQGINVQTVWNNYKGEGIRIAVVDDGLEIDHPDLLANIASGLSYNYLNGSSDPTPTNPDDSHGTSVAGIIAARDYNGIGVRGVAPRANLVGYNYLQYQFTSTEADAMTRGSPDVHISSNSWGAADDTGDLSPANLAWKTAIDTGLSTGRHGLGTIYVWAAGNGGYTVDNSNYDGNANYRGVIAVAAVDDAGQQAFYSEQGANILISAPGGDTCNTLAITTTDLTGNKGQNYTGANDYSNRDYTRCMNGTSAAAPMVSGAVALMLQANPNLGWRDVRYILATTARKNDPGDSGWSNNKANLPVNHKYGFGVIDTNAAVNKAIGWPKLGPQLTVEGSQQPDTPIADYDPKNPSAGVITGSINIPGGVINKIETVEITFNSDHTYPGDLEITLTSPSGTQSILAQTHACIAWVGQQYVSVDCNSSYNNWVFTSVRHLDEAANGTWTLSVKDGDQDDVGTFQSWKLKIYGH